MRGVREKTNSDIPSRNHLIVKKPKIDFFNRNHYRYRHTKFFLKNSDNYLKHTENSKLEKSSSFNNICLKNSETRR
jgi:hypothetical protein